MADESQLEILHQGVAAWNEWRRKEGVHIEVDLRSANLSGPTSAGRTSAGSPISAGPTSATPISATNLSGANLSRADLSGANLLECNFGAAEFEQTVLSDIDLSRCTGLELSGHRGPSSIDVRTLQRSGPLPLVFLRGVGLPQTLIIEYLPSLLNQAKAIDFYSCFISYSHADMSFALRLHDQLQAQGIRCWRDEHQLPPGDEVHC
jgi:uncharacterized protein YjbI with pentapeptide repeats